MATPSSEKDTKEEEAAGLAEEASGLAPAIVASQTLTYDVKGQSGTIPSLVFGTATLSGDKCLACVKAALAAGYRAIDTALLYGNQQAVGQAIRESGIPREEITVITKIAFFPPAEACDDATWLWKALNGPSNAKGNEAKALETCLEQLGLEYVDVLLIHCPCVDKAEYHAGGLPHLFELQNKDPNSIFSLMQDCSAGQILPDGTTLREAVLGSLLAKAKAAPIDPAALRAIRRRTWQGMEAALRSGKAKAIGVSNFPVELIEEMTQDTGKREAATVAESGAGAAAAGGGGGPGDDSDFPARVHPCINQLELHPRFSSPALRAKAAELGMRLCGYGSGNTTRIEKDHPRHGPVLRAIADRHGVLPQHVKLAWTLQHGAACVARSSDPGHIKENTKVLDVKLTPEDMATLDELNEDYFYYWSPHATTQTLTRM